ncbi:MAG: hypothetical protein IIY06_02285 [Proteobacteria bacterium]|nr:hypothetical protein [Pseudomonadota bacterium]
MKTMNAAITAVTANQKLINETFIANAASFGSIKAAYLPLSELFVDEDYQRKPQSKINKISANWDDDKCGFLEVAYRADIGKFAIIDGQNRFYAAKQRGIDRLPCHILINIKVKEEAFRFAYQDENKTIVNTYDKFKAEVFAGVPESLELKRVCDKFGIKVKNNSAGQTGYLRSITQAKKTLSACGAQGLTWIFENVRDSGWHNVKGAYSYIIMSALHNIYMMTDTDDLNLVKKNICSLFEKTTPDRIMAQATMAFYDANKTSSLTRFLQKTCVPDAKSVLITG